MADTLADSLIHLKNSENAGKKTCEVKPASKILGSVFKILQKEGFIGNFEFVDDGRAGIYRVQLMGKITNCGAIKPRHSVSKNDYTAWEKRYLPSKNLGTLIISTPNGLMTHKEAEEGKTGGKLIAFIY